MLKCIEIKQVEIHKSKYCDFFHSLGKFRYFSSVFSKFSIVRLTFNGGKSSTLF